MSGMVWSTVAEHLLESYREANEAFLRNALREPVLSLRDLGPRQLGHWSSARRELAISTRHVLEEPWNAVLDTLRHEMAHQFVSEVLGADDEAPHGPAFREACRRLRADPAGTRRTEPVADAQSTRIRKLLALAGGTHSPHEAAQALRVARRLMQDGDGPVDEDRNSHWTLELGRVRKRHEAWEYVLANLLSDGFGVSIVWVPSYSVPERREGTAMLLHGRPHQLATAEHAFGFLTGLLPRAWREHRAREGLAGDRERGRWAHGFLVGVRERLLREPTQAPDEVPDETPNEVPKAGPGEVPEPVSGESPAETSQIVLKREDRLLRDFVRWRHPRMRSVSVGGGAAESGSFRDGRRQGRDVHLFRPLGAGRSGAAGPGLLGDSS